ncbi:MAG TPA: RNA polymerase sigma factor [Candidatus Angelobacter sp.]
MEGFTHSAQWRVGRQADVPSKPMAQSPSDDLELLRQLSRGSESAFETLYERYQGPIYRFALHMSGNTATAEEITQEVFMAVISKPKTYDSAKGTVAGYLFGIARNLMRHRMQQSANDVPFVEDSMEEDATGPTEDIDLLEELSQSESLVYLRKAVLSLPEAYREVVVLCELEEMSYPEAAAVLKCSPGTIASRLNRAKAMLKTKLRGQGCVR